MKRIRTGLGLVGLAMTLVALTAPPSYAADQVMVTSPHAATFSGPYNPKAGIVNHASTCYAGAVQTGSTDTCQFYFTTPRTACVAETGYTFMGRLTVGTYTVGVPLMKMGGGVFEGHGVVLTGGVPTVYDVHIAVEGLCDDTTLDIVLDQLDLTRDLDSVSYTFSGYANA